MLGLGLGGCFSLFMLVALDHLPSPTQAGALNALMQGGGFVLAAMAPLIKAQLQQISSNWMSGWLYQASVATLVLLLVMRFNPVAMRRSWLPAGLASLFQFPQQCIAAIGISPRFEQS